MSNFVNFCDEILRMLLCLTANVTCEIIFNLYSKILQNLSNYRDENETCLNFITHSEAAEVLKHRTGIITS